jgi:hypothetical protein
MSDTRARIEAILAHWLQPLPPGVHDELVDDLEELVEGEPAARPLVVEVADERRLDQGTARAPVR